MTPERWKEIEALFEQALDLPAGERAAFLEKTCTDDQELRREIESLLNSHARAGTFIDNQSRFFSGESVAEIGAAIPAGELIGPYRVLREIGRGGMGAVYLAERADEQYQKQVAIKLIKRGMDTDSVLRHFRSERQILASFDHPNIARLFDGGTTADGLPYFVMEYVEGVPLDKYCDAHELSIAERLKLFREVCAAVTYAHRHTVIHRDIKPSNILVTADGVVKLLDFGLAKILQSGDGAESLMTATGVRPMTPEYASPEQVRGEPLTTATDVYSLGVVLYELLTGGSPYRLTTHSPREIERAITEQEPTRPSTATPDANRKSKIENPVLSGATRSRTDRKSLKGDRDNIVLMALRKEPARRYQSVEQFANDIRRHLEARPVLARRDTVGYRARKFVQRNRVATGAALLILISLVAGLIATTWEAHRAKIEKARAERRFNDVRRLAHSVLFDYHDAIKNLPGATRARERLVKDALTYLDSLAAESAGDPSLQRELAAAYERVGDVRGEAFGASLGDRAGAMNSYQKALHIREELVTAAPRDVQNRRGLAAIYKKIGDELLETSETARGLAYIQKALALFSSLAQEQPEDTDIQRDLAETHNSVGSALQDSGDMAGTLEHLHEALPIFEELLRGDPQDRTLRRDLSVTYQNIARASFLTGETAAALEHNQKSLVLREALLAEDPTNADYRRMLAVSYQDDGDYRAWKKDTAGALESFRKKLLIDEQSLTADPANAQASSDLAYSNLRLGELSADSDNYPEAVKFFARAADAYEKSAASDPQNQLTPMRVAGTYGRLGKVQAAVGQIFAAHKACEKATDILLRTPDNPAHTMARRTRAIAFMDLADAYATIAGNSSTSHDSVAESWRAARDMYRHSLSVLEDLKSRGVLDAEETPEIENIRRKIADCDASLAKLE